MPNTHSDLKQELKTLLDLLEPISKKMQEHHTVDVRPVHDLQKIIASIQTMRKKVPAKTKNKKTIRLQKRITPYLTFKDNPFKKQHFHLDGEFVSFRKKKTPLYQVIKNIDLLKANEIDPRKLQGFHALHEEQYHIVNNIRLSVVHLYECLKLIHDDEENPKKSFLPFRRKSE